MEDQTMLSKVKHIFMVAVAAVAMISCSEDVIYQDVRELPEEGWAKDDAASFAYNMHDTTGYYEIVVDVRNRSTYKYQNLWLFVEAVNPQGTSYADTIECILADNLGRWIGDGAASYVASEYHLPVSFMPLVKFPQQGEYKFFIYQGMREDTLRGISDIGIRIRHTYYNE